MPPAPRPHVLEYWRNASPITHLQAQRRERLAQEKPAVIERGLECPDCGSRLILKLSRYGRFYGCKKWSKTGCTGAVGAYDDGTPRGTPGDAKTRKLRQRVLKHFEAMPNKATKEDVVDRICNLALGGQDPTAFKIGLLDMAACERVLALLDAWFAPESMWQCITAPDVFEDVYDISEVELSDQEVRVLAEHAPSLLLLCPEEGDA